MSTRPEAATNVAALLALAPGFVLPFVLSKQLGAANSDTVLLASSVALTLIGILGSSIEVTTISEVGRLAGRDRRPSPAAMTSYRLRILRFVVLVMAVIGSGLIALYGWQTHDRSTFFTLAGVFMLLPLLGTFSSVKSGQVIAQGGVNAAVLMQSARTVIPLALVLCWPTVPLVLLPVGFCVGEAVRWGVLTKVSGALGARLQDDDTRLKDRGLLWLSASSATAQSGPATDRSFLSTAPAGSITAYEIADKIYYAALQFLSTGLLLRRVAGWARMPAMGSASGRRALRHDFTLLVVAAAVAAVLGIVACLLGPHVVPLPTGWRAGFTWAAILLTGLPLSIVNLACSRLLVINGRQSLLIRFSIGFTLANAAADTAFFFLLGPIGIPVATTLVRALSTVFYWRTMQRVVRDSAAAADQTDRASTTAAGVDA